MSTVPITNITIAEDTPSEQEETRKIARTMLKEVQNVVGTCKENLFPRMPPGKELLVSATKQPTDTKRFKMVEQLTKATQTTFEDEHNLVAEKPTESYWAKVAETRRLALKEALDENARLIVELCDKTDEVNELQSTVESLKSVVETMVEMLDEKPEQKIDTEFPQVDDSGIAHSWLEDEKDNEH